MHFVTMRAKQIMDICLFRQSSSLYQATIYRGYVPVTTGITVNIPIDETISKLLILFNGKITSAILQQPLSGEFIYSFLFHFLMFIMDKPLIVIKYTF